ncbi:MAG: hypothetical protein GX339_02315 [Tissierellia bacterium]|nr:hypothetical protein [Tissierellia bacterium]
MLKKLSVFIVLILLLACSRQEASLVMVFEDYEEEIDVEIIYNHSEASTFPTVVRSSGEKPVETEYKGVELKLLFETLGIDTSQYSRVTFNASDGYRIILSMEEINQPSNVYLTFERDGEILKSKKEGGNGPFQLIIRRDPFSQRWIKHVDKIIFQ